MYAHQYSNTTRNKHLRQGHRLRCGVWKLKSPQEEALVFMQKGTERFTYSIFGTVNTLTEDYLNNNSSHVAKSKVNQVISLL